MQPEILKFFADYVSSELGIVYAEHNYFQLQNRLEEIAKLMGKESVEALYEEGKPGITGQFRQLLLDLSTNNETSFFRDQKVFSSIEEVVTKMSEEGKLKDKELKIWSAASSTGQEAISVSILLNELKDKRISDLRFHISGSDISERVLERAKSFRYSQLEIQRGLSALNLVKYFSKEPDDTWKANDLITKNIDYRKQNLKDPFPTATTYQIILCRNVLIYQSVEGKVDILRRLTKLLEPGGYLILGAGESLMGLNSDYDQEFVQGAVLYKKKNSFTEAA